MAVSTLALNDGTHVPWIAFGSGNALFGNDATRAFSLAIQNGFTHLDGAQMYSNETPLGASIAASGKPRSDLYITARLGALAPGETPTSALKKSLERLGVEYVDLYLIHQAYQHVGKLKQVWKGMEDAKAAGLTRSIGVSNFTVDDLEDILEVPDTTVPAVNQVEAHPYVWKALGPNLAFHERHRIVTCSYGGLSPIVFGRGGPLDAVVERVRRRLENTHGRPVSDGQVLNKWLKQKGVLVATKSAKAERMREYLETEDIPELTPEEMKLVETAGAKRYERFFPNNWPAEQ